MHLLLKQPENTHTRKPVEGLDPAQLRREIGLDELGQPLANFELARTLGSGRKLLSETVIDFARPMLDAEAARIDEHHMRDVLGFAIAVWNAVAAAAQADETLVPLRFAPTSPRMAVARFAAWYAELMAQDDAEAEALGIPWETVRAEFGFDDVGRRALRGGARDELLADYPHLREEDIEQARRFIEDEDRALRRRDRRPPFDLARFQPRKRPVVISEFDAWVGTTNIPDHFEFGKGWWDYVELIRTFAAQLDSEDVRVVGHYIVETPPPTELLPMPAVAIVTPAATFAFRYDFGTWSLKQPVALNEWVLSVDREAPYRGPTFGLFDEARDLRPEGLDGLSPDYLFGPYRQDQAKFSCVVKDQWAVAMFLRILAWCA